MERFLSVKKILVIEEQGETRNLFLKGLEAEGFDPMAAENGLTGVQLAQEELPDLIISEISVPKLDGYSVLTTLRQNLPTAVIPLIFVTTKANRDDIRKGMELGADDYLTKPCTIGELLRAIAACFEKRNILKDCYTKGFQTIAEPHLAETIEATNLETVFASDPLLNDVFNFIEANYHQQITLSDVAAAVGYSSTYLTNLVRRQTGKTVQSWIIEHRMASVRRLLLETDQTIEAIALQVGYHSVAHLFRQFRQYHQASPQAWRKEYRNQLK
jgi:YesN/AraC family two-component response regulator